MPDRPDYSNYLLGSTHYALDDMGELAARLGSVDIYDRRGEILFIENWSRGFAGWWSISTANEAQLSIISNHVHHTHYVLKMLAPTANPKTVSIAKVSSEPFSNLFGFEVLFAFPSTFDTFTIYTDIEHTSGTERGVLKFTYSTKKLSIKISSTTYQDILTLGWSSFGAYNFIPMKFVVDYHNHIYKRAMFAGHDIDISAYPTVTPKDTEIQYITNYIELIGTGISGQIAYIGHVILTANDK